jgi:hypothetical protein
MLNNTFKTRNLVMIAATAILALPAFADWKPGETYKMHFPQLPDPNGWDVNFTYPKVLADDWKCTETGPVTDIHFWLSSRLDQADPALIGKIHVSIHSDIPVGPNNTYSRPGELLWQRDFSATEIKVVPWQGGKQGWYDPQIQTASPYEYDNHQLMWQVNIEDILHPFKQEEGTIYWLDLSIVTTPGANGMFGWKSSLQNFNDDAVWGGYYDPTGIDQYAGPALWQELVYPDGRSMDLSFVITPEPGSMLAIAMGAMTLLLRRRR